MHRHNDPFAWLGLFAVAGLDWMHNHGLTILTGLSFVACIAYHLTLAGCAIAKTRHELRMPPELQGCRPPAPPCKPRFDHLDGRN